MVETGISQQALVSSPGKTAAMGWTWTALLVAVIALAGSLWLSVGMNLKACPLCLYQRTFVMGVVAVLLVGLLTDPRQAAMLNLLALPLALAALGVALFHEYLETTGKLECPGGVLGWGTAPQQSVMALAILLALLLIGAVRNRNVGGPGLLAISCAAVLGVLFALAAIKSAPPMPAPPAKPYDQALEICRPPFRPQ